MTAQMSGFVYRSEVTHETILVVIYNSYQITSYSSRLQCKINSFQSYMVWKWFMFERHFWNSYWTLLNKYISLKCGFKIIFVNYKLGAIETAKIIFIAYRI